MRQDKKDSPSDRYQRRNPAVLHEHPDGAGQAIAANQSASEMEAMSGLSGGMQHWMEPAGDRWGMPSASMQR